MGVCFSLSWNASQASQPVNTTASLACLRNQSSQPAVVERVVDGDTLVLNNDLRVRLIGLNTLELSARSQSDKTWARMAADTLESWLSEPAVTLFEGADSKDRYGRLLAHVQLHNGVSAAALLIERGLGVAVAIGRNTRCASEFLKIEQLARQQQRGIWRFPGEWFIGDRQALRGNEKGFHVVTSSIQSTRSSRNKSVLVLANGLTVKLGRKGRSLANSLSVDDLSDLIGKPVEVRGWLTSQSGQTSLTLHHPANLQLLTP